jgi:hypothetical protein
LLLAARVGAEGLDDLKETTPAERAAAQTMMMKEKLSLTDEQLPKVKGDQREVRRADGPDHQGLRGHAHEDGSDAGGRGQEGSGAEGRALERSVRPVPGHEGEMRDKLMERIKAQRAQKGS